MKSNSDLEDLISHGRYFEARSKAEDILKTGADPRVSQLLALSISKAGMPELALETIEPVYRQSPDDSESAGIMGSIYKELFRKNQKTTFALQSRDTYLKNFTLTKNYYTGINAASMSALAGQMSKAREIAAQVIIEVDKTNKGFWELATLGEANLLVKNKVASIESYVQARKLAGNDWGKVTSVHNQLWLLNHYIAVPNEVMKLFAPPNVVAFSGHMIDHPNRATPRFPAGIERQVKEAIRNSIRTMNARIGYTSIACGSDILFIEAMLEEGGEVNLFLPFSQADFVKTSIAFAGKQWVSRFFDIIDKHPVNYISTGMYSSNDELFTFLSRVIYGSAVLRGQATHSEPHLLTVLSEMDLKKREGGTRDTIDRWPYRQKHVNINPDIFISQPLSTTTEPAETFSFERNNDKLMYLVYVGVEESLLKELDKVIAEHEHTIEDQSLAIKAVDLLQSSRVLAMETDMGAMEFVAMVENEFRQYKTQNKLKFALHAGSVSISAKKLSGSGLEHIKNIGNHISAGSICASDYFASVLALSNRNYNLSYAGVIQSSEIGYTRSFFTVEKLA